MKTGIKTDYKVLSTKKCKECGRPLKYNSELKGHVLCFVCFKISKGKDTPELIRKQKENKRNYGTKKYNSS